MPGKTKVNDLSEPDARRLLAACPDNQFVATLEDVLQRCRSDGWLTIHEAAGLAETSVRSFQRRLAKQGETFARVSDQSRSNFATHLLTCTDRSLGDIARELGYTQSTNFVRAFKRWTGTTPKQYRSRTSVPSKENAPNRLA